jgi:hypothetical protein
VYLKGIGDVITGDPGEPDATQSFTKRYKTGTKQINLLMYDMIVQGASDVRAFTIELLRSRGVPLNPASRDQLEVIYDFLRNEIEYVRDPRRIELFQDTKKILQTRAGDCDDKTILGGAMLKAIGYEVCVVLLDMFNEKDFNHVYLWAIYDGEDAEDIIQWKVTPGFFNLRKYKTPIIAIDPCYLPGKLGDEVPLFYRRKALILF